MKDWGFVSGSYKGFAPESNPARTINLLVQTLGQVNSKTKRRFLLKPGKRRFGTLPAAPGRAIFAQDGECYAVAGNKACRILDTGSVTTLGTVQNAAAPAVIASNGSRGNQRLFVSGGNGYIWNTSTSTFAQITDPQFPTGVITGGYLDGYFVVVTADRFQISSLLDGTAWGADVGQRVGAPENLTGAIIDHELIWLAGATQTEVWADTGAASFPIEPVTGVFLEYGLEAPHAICRMGDSIAWLCSDERGGRVVMRNQGYNAVPISHEGITAALTALDSVADARMFALQVHGHPLVVLTIPSQRVTLVYDAKENEWVEWLHWNAPAGRYESERMSCHAYAFGKHLTLDRETGDIWEITPEVFDEGDGRPLRWERVTPTLNDEGRELFFHGARLDASVGVGLAGSSSQGYEPTVVLDWSDDSGQTWSVPQTTSLGKLGVFDYRPEWWMLGGGRNRAFRLSGSDPVQTVLNDLILDVSQGAH